MAKSLKMFVSESAIKKEISTWSLKDCEDYLDKHKNDQKESSLMHKKISIVTNFFNAIKIATHTSGKERKKALENIPFEFLIKNAPNENIKDPPNKKLKSYQKNTGIYLWSLGYNVKRFLGAGCSAVVWGCEGNKVMRVACNNKYLGFIKINNAATEIDDAETIKNIIDSDPKNSHHLFNTKYIENNNKEKAIFEAELSTHGDLEKFKSTKDYNNKIENILQMATDSLKGLNVLHSNGYSHNDIKPDNILITDKTKKNGTSRINLKIADFGVMTNINKTYTIFTNRKFRAPDFWKLGKEAVAKRDIYSLGCIFIGLLMEDNNFSQNYQKLAKDLVSIGSEKFFQKYLQNNYQNIDDNSKNNIILFLETIIKMVQPSYKNRIEIAKALENIKNIKKNL